MQATRGSVRRAAALAAAAFAVVAAVTPAGAGAATPAEDGDAPAAAAPEAAPQAAAAANVVPPVPPRVPPQARPPAPPEGGSLPTIAGPSPRSRKDPAYSAIASALARGPRAVFCWNRRDWAELSPRHGDVVQLGYVDLRAPRQVNLSPLVCRQLDMLRYLGLRPRPTQALALAVDVLAHETMHTIGIEDEHVAECYGMQLAGRTSAALGTSPAYGRALGRLLWSSYDGPTLPSRYRSGACRDGGELDLEPESASWPVP